MFDAVLNLYEDDHYLAVSKPSGLLVYSFKKKCSDSNNLVDIVREKFNLPNASPIHRLDRGVSGVLLFGKSSEAIKLIKEKWHSVETKKKYITLVKGEISSSGKFNKKIRNDKGYNQNALTEYEPIYKFDTTSLVYASIKTGRKHQIRRHFSRSGFHILGDMRYGYRDLNDEFREKFDLRRMFLHSSSLSFYHPYLEKNISIFCPLPLKLRDVLVKMDIKKSILENI